MKEYRLAAEIEQRTLHSSFYALFGVYTVLLY